MFFYTWHQFITLRAGQHAAYIHIFAIFKRLKQKAFIQWQWRTTSVFCKNMWNDEHMGRELKNQEKLPKKNRIVNNNYCLLSPLFPHKIHYITDIVRKNISASTGNRTRINSLVGCYANHYTIDTPMLVWHQTLFFHDFFF